MRAKELGYSIIEEIQKELEEWFNDTKGLDQEAYDLKMRLVRKELNAAITDNNPYNNGVVIMALGRYSVIKLSDTKSVVAVNVSVDDNSRLQWDYAVDYCDTVEQAKKSLAKEIKERGK